MGLSLAAQKIEFILTKNPNPSDLVEFKTPTYYTSLTILNHEIGLYEREAGGIFKLSETKFQCAVFQYGYSKFQESCFKISAAKSKEGHPVLNTKSEFSPIFITLFIDKFSVLTRRLFF